MDFSSVLQGIPVHYLIIAALLLLCVPAVIIYNQLVRSRQMVDEAWSGMDVQLKRRADLIPNLVQTVSTYAEHEQDTFVEVTKARAAANAAGSDNPYARALAEENLSAAVSKLLVTAEAYPQLSSSESFLALQQELSNLENEIQMARRYYNGAARAHNVAVQSFPANLFGFLMGFRSRDFFEITDVSDRQVPAVNFARRR